MAHVFISYARSNERLAEQAAELLRSAGYDVWRDDELPAHRTYGDVIEERLKTAKAVVVLWSAEAAKSQWVRAEADAARHAGTLVQASLDGTVPPMPFNQIQCAHLGDWHGRADAAGWRKLAGSVAALAGQPKAPESTATQTRQVSVCVLPFANMSGDPEQEYFSDGISEDITTDLSKVSALGVTARNTAFTFKGTSADVPTIARKLDVSHVLEGSVRKAGNRVRITAQLIDGRSGAHVWAERYDRDLTDIFAIQDEISTAIVAALKLKLLPEEKKAIEHRGTSSAEAYNLYLMARQYWVSGNHGDRRRQDRVVRICQRAVDLDPGYAKAWALMALAQADLHLDFGDAGDASVKSAERALLLDPTIAEAHSVKARVLAHLGRLDEADEEIAVSLELDPESWEVNKEAARLYLRQRRIPEARQHFEKAVSVMETDYHSWALLVTCYEAQKDRANVLRGGKMMFEQAQTALAHDPSNGAALGIGAGGLAILGQADRAKEWIERALLVDPDNANMRYNFACILAAYLDDADAAIDLLEPIMPQQPLRAAAQTDPDFDRIREHPRYKSMMAAAERGPGPGASARS